MSSGSGGPRPQARHRHGRQNSRTADRVDYRQPIGLSLPTRAWISRFGPIPTDKVSPALEDARLDLRTDGLGGRSVSPARSGLDMPHRLRQVRRWPCDRHPDLKYLRTWLYLAMSDGR